MAANFTVHGRIGPYLEFIQDFITVLVICTCKNEIGPIKTEAARVLITLNIDFSDGSMADTFVPIICKNKDDPSKNKDARVLTIFITL